MESFRIAVFGVCSAAMGLTLAESILPIEKFEKEIRLLLSLLLMTVLLKPLTTLRITYQPNTEETPEIAAEITEQAISAKEYAAAERIKQVLNLELEQKNVPATVIEVRMHIQEDGSININEVIISGNVLTGTVYLRELLGREVSITKGDEMLADTP